MKTETDFRISDRGVKETIVNLWTGFFDYNGAKIYEGDIVKIVLD